MADRLADGAAAAPDVRLGLPALARFGVRLDSGLVAVGAVSLAALAVFFTHWPVLSHYFYGDDFVALADITSRGTWEYIRDLVLLQDETPNWRVLPGLFYLVAFETFGLDAFPFLLTNVVVHIGTTVLIFWFVRRVLNNTWPAFLAALFFGLTPAHVPTVGQVTAFNNVLAAFLLMLSVVALYEAGTARSLGWRVLSVLAFAGAVASNEAAAVLAPVLALVVVWRVDDGNVGGWNRSRWREVALLSAPYIAIGGAALIGFAACGCTEAADSDLFAGGEHLSDNFWLYLGRLLYPIGMEPPGDVGVAHFVAGGVAAGLLGLALVRGPQLAYWAVAFLLLALIPYLPLKLWSAARYTYVAAVPFSILAALLFTDIARYAARLRFELAGAVALVAFGVMGLYGWQTWSQNQVIASDSTRLERLVGDLQDEFGTVPPGSTVYVHGLGSPLAAPLFQCSVTPAIGRVLWGEAALFTDLWQQDWVFRIRPGHSVFVVAYGEDGTLGPLEIETLQPGDEQYPELIYLPRVDPLATGNLCLNNLPAQP